MKAPLNTSQFPVQKELGSKAAAARGRKWFASMLSAEQVLSFLGRTPSSCLSDTERTASAVRSMAHPSVQQPAGGRNPDVSNSCSVNWRLLPDPSLATVLRCCRVCEVWCVETVGGADPAGRSLPGDREGGSPWPTGAFWAGKDLAATGSHHSHPRQLASSLHCGEYP